jgi:hypothetical protein
VFREGKDGAVVKASGFGIWNSSLKRKEYFGCDYFYNRKAPEGYLNLAESEYKILPKDWSNNKDIIAGYEAIRDLLRESICKNDDRILKYLMVWSAYVTGFQKTKGV